MTVKELKEELDQYNEDQRVLIPGYEGGSKNIYKVEEDEFQEQDRAWYYGNFITEDNWNWNENIEESESCILIS